MPFVDADCKRHAEDGVVLPTNVRRSVFTTHDVENLDSNKTGNLSHGDFHGTCITVTNHLSKENSGIRQPPIILDHNTKSNPKLPDRYIIVNTQFINVGQIPVLGADQPLYAICKQLQWQFLESLGEGKFVMTLGALHIEDKFQLMLGKMLRGSGWDTALAHADILSSSRAQSALNDHHIKRTRCAHQVFLVSLPVLK